MRQDNTSASSPGDRDTLSPGDGLLKVYELLYAAYGPQHWWPAETPFEVVVGAILTQSAAWVNVEKAIRNLKAAGVLSPGALRAISTEELAQLIYPSGYFNAKARKMKAFVEHLGMAHDDSLDGMFGQGTLQLREELLGIHGIGPETADSILLYAARKPIFVIDAYTSRIAARLELAPNGARYDSLQALFMQNLAHDVKMFNEYHALLVRHGKSVCRKSPRCDGCCLSSVCRMQA